MTIIQKWLWPLILLCGLLPSKVNAQISANPSSGCAPLVGVSFTGMAGASNISWNFGDNSSSPLANPTHTYSNPGTYTVTYTATVGGSPVSHTLTINVYGKPDVDFSVVSPTPASGCVPLQVTFQSNSTGGGGTSITQHNWTFGDGGVNTGNNANPSYVYTIPGQYSVTLIVTDQNGCDSSLTFTNLVTASAPPTAIINSTPNPPSSCNPPLNVNFNGSTSSSNSPLGGGLTFSWDFGNGNTSTSATPPTQTYSTSGTYPVTLTVTDSSNCSTTATTNVVIANPEAIFEVDDTVCMEVTFIDTASSAGIHTWHYGDGSTGTSNTHTYAAGGTYNVMLVVSTGACADTMTKTIFVQEVIADFTWSPSYTCSLPQTITFNNTTLNGSTYQWIFDSTLTHYNVTPSSSNATNPVVTITDLDTNQYTIHNMDPTLAVTLIATGSAGCVDTVKYALVDTVYIPTARLQPDITSGCAPLSVTFSDSSLSNETIISRVWDFGDGTVTSSNVTSIPHTYTNPGIYHASLVIVNSAGCADTSYAITIKVGAMPTANFSLSPTPVCPGVPVQFTDLSTSGGTPIDTWHYSTDGGFMMSSCFNDPNPAWGFTAATGPQPVTLTVCSHGCCDQVTIPNAIDVDGPLVEFTSKSHCDTPFVYTFTGTIQDADSWTWDFGDGTVLTGSTQPVVTHTYATTGDYQVMLIGYNNTSGCPADTFLQTVYVRDIQAAFTTNDSIFCSGTQRNFNAGASVDVHTFSSNGYTWLWGDGTAPTISSSPLDTHVFAPGLHNVRLVVRDINGCYDTASYTVMASSVTADFNPSAFSGCVPWTVNFTDLSVSDTTLTAWSWSFGDGSSGNTQNPSNTYTDANANDFDVTLNVTNILGCTDTITRTLIPSKPVATFTPTTSINICAGDSVRFQPTVQNHAGYSWDFGDGGNSGNVNPWHTYTTAGSYPVSLIVTDSIGCTQTFNFPVTVKVQDYPNAGFSSNVDTLAELCFPLQVVFTDTSQANIFGSRQWDFGNGSTTVPNASVGTSYTTPGTYSVSLVVSTTFGCRDTMIRTFDVRGPVADFDLSPSVICKGEDITFTIKDTSGVETFHWDFGDGSDTLALSPVTHNFNYHPPGGTGMVTLIVWSEDSSCARTISKPITIHDVIADFERNNEAAAIDTAHCLGIADKFTNTSTNATTFIWNFGDGNTSTGAAPTHTFTAPGTYAVSIAITNSMTGCVDTIWKDMVIFPLPVVDAEGGDTCRGSAVQLTASGGDTYSWSPSTGLSNAAIANPTASPSVTTTYLVTATDTNGCQGTAIAVAHIIQPPPSVTWDTAIVIGESVVLPFNISPVNDYTYSWSPADSLSCTDCHNPTANPVVNTTYTLTVTDKYGCFVSTSTFYVEILPVSSVDVPSAFTPNGDGTNDIVYVEGWGIKQLLEFNIYNRWGELVFSTNDINTGWDGTYKGVPQNTDSYAYTVKVETYIDSVPLEKKGFIKLLR